MLNQVSLEVHKQFSWISPNQLNPKLYLFLCKNHLVGCSDTPPEFLTMSEVLCNFRPDPLDQQSTFHRNFRLPIGTSDGLRMFPITSDLGSSGNKILTASELPIRHQNFRPGSILYISAWTIANPSSFHYRRLNTLRLIHYGDLKIWPWKLEALQFFGFPKSRRLRFPPSFLWFVREKLKVFHSNFPLPDL